MSIALPFLFSSIFSPPESVERAKDRECEALRFNVSACFAWPADSGVMMCGC